MKQIFKKLHEAMQKKFPASTAQSVQIFAPGRVNLIGEHIDYNGGHVFPFAIERGSYFLIRPRQDRKLKFYSLNFKHIDVLSTSLDELYYQESLGWVNYPLGVVSEVIARGAKIDQGFDLCLYGNIPNGAGLSSSASIEVGMALGLDYLYDLALSKKDLAIIGQKAENDFVGVNCGIMDQFAVAMGKEDQAILLDTASLDYSYAPLILEEYDLVIASSNKKRGLLESPYNQRRAECEEALTLLQKVYPIQNLCELSLGQLEAEQGLFKNPIVYQRARHAVTEEARCLLAHELLQKNDILGLGKLMFQSHESLRLDYEVTGKELDCLVHQAMQEDGCIGSRMTGAGFGGCTISLVKKTKVKSFIQELEQKYLAEIGYRADFYLSKASQGVRVIGVENV